MYRHPVCLKIMPLQMRALLIPPWLAVLLALYNFPYLLPSGLASIGHMEGAVGPALVNGLVTTTL